MTLWDNILLPAIQKSVGILPNVLTALVIVLLGCLVAVGFDHLTRRLLQRIGFNRMADRAGILTFLRNTGYTHEPSQVVGKLVFWLLMLISLLTVAETLQLTMIATAMQTLVAFIPNVIAVMMIVVFGALGARIISGIVRGAAREVGVEFADLLAKTAHILLLIMVLIIAFRQLAIESIVLEITFGILIGAFGLSVALTLGLGSRTVAQNIIAGVYVRRSFHIGQQIRVSDRQGEILQMGTINTVLKTDKNGIVTLPNSILVQEVSESDDGPPADAVPFDR